MECKDKKMATAGQEILSWPFHEGINVEMNYAMIKYKKAIH